MRLLITRPEPGAGETAHRLAQMGHQVLCDPMLRIVPTLAPLPEGAFDALAFTSLNGVRALWGHPERARLGMLPAFAVGSRTAAEARRSGFADVTDCAGDLTALSGMLARLPRGSRVLHAAGAERAGDLAPTLAAHGIGVDVAVLYQSMPARDLAPVILVALRGGRLDVALHFSPRTVDALLHGVARADAMGPFLALRHLCLSAAVAAPLVAAGAAVAVAEAPNEDALLTLL